MGIGRAEGEFADLYAQHGASVASYLARRLPAADQGDALAEVFTVVWRRIDSVPAHPLPWLYGIARNVVANQLRAQRRRGLLHLRIAREPALTDPVRGEAEDRVIRALRQLSQPDQETLRLIAWEDLNIEEAARVLRCSPNAFRTRLHRARGRLRARFDALDEDSQTFRAFRASKPSLSPDGRR